MRKTTVASQFSLEIAFLLDKGINYSMEEVRRHIENKDVVDWLEQEFPFGTDNGLDFSLFKEAERKFLHDELEGYCGGYAGNEKRKWGIVNNGLCILLCWTIEILRGVTRDTDDA